ncbi:hypothetical protein KDN34_05050 [Shewanella yunxiaonensis]|uniref:Uncharacterized protein n=1 Tax=Shewanella yunxiaonensis TaxID=2829809 RepID=A0ABX7YXP1_9GAMM|nr:hypothetical protein [Shewanella yunxiaonensis]QUN06821.1 hypothetical protein KDN34_05050 [Shewanella yunxiaonensis]
MKVQSLVIAIIPMLSMYSSSYANTIDDALKLPINAFKDQIYKALKDDKKLGSHIPKTAKEQQREKLQICKFWLDQYSHSATEEYEIKTIDSCTAAGIDMSKYRK